MKRRTFRSHCAINYSLEIIGDHWSLLIIRDIVYFGKRTFGDFLESDEHISPSILTQRLAHLEQQGILVKRPHASDRRKEVYWLTEKGLDLIPILHELSAWGSKHDPETEALHEWMAEVEENRETIMKLIRTTVKNGGSVAEGAESVIDQWERMKLNRNV